MAIWLHNMGLETSTKTVTNSYFTTGAESQPVMQETTQTTAMV